MIHWRAQAPSPLGLLACIGFLFAASAAEPIVRLEPAPEFQLPATPDCNSPCYWVDGELRLFTSNQRPSVSVGPSLERLGKPEPCTFEDGAQKLRWIEAVYSRDDGVLFGLYHREEYRGECPDREYFTVPDIGVARSDNRGRTWRDLGLVLQDSNVNRSCDTPNKFFAGGVGDPSWAIDRSGGFAYIFFSSYTDPVANQGVQIARVALTDLDTPVGKVWRWNSGRWNTPGIGGAGTPIIPARIAWSDRNADAFWGPSVHWNTYLQTHVVLANRAKDANWTQEGVYVFFAPDLSRPDTFTAPRKIRDGGAWYVQVIGDSDMRGTDSLAGQSARFFQQGKSNARIVFEKPRQPDGDGRVRLSGELRQWHPITLTLNGPFARERDSDPNPFTDYAFTVTFTHASGTPRYIVPGYFAADGNAAHSSAESGTQWRAHLSPDKPGSWSYAIAFSRGKNAAVGEGSGQPLPPFDGQRGVFRVERSDKSGRDFRARGRLRYVGKHHLQFAGSKTFFLKAGADSPENLLAYADFDGTRANQRPTARPGEATPTSGLKTWQAHLRDWRTGDPTWKDGRGKGLIGALNYLAGKGANAFSFLPYNAGGDGDDVWPFVEREAKRHYDCSKLDQWGIVFTHAQRLGLYLHFKLQETEIDDHRVGHEPKSGVVPTALDGGALGIERKLYCRELVARFAHHLALNWNIGEENTQSTAEINAMVDYLRAIDPYRHHVVIHTYPDWQERVYTPLLGLRSRLTGASLQNDWQQTHRRTLQWIKASAVAGKAWVVANDEQGGADTGVPPDLGYAGFAGRRPDGKPLPTVDDIRKATLWGNLMAGGAGVEYYFGYQLPQNDLRCEDWRSRDQSWEYARIALAFFDREKIPFWEMTNADQLIGNATNDNSKYGLAKFGAVYLVYLPNGGPVELDLTGVKGRFQVDWFNPRVGGSLRQSSVRTVHGGGKVALGTPPTEPTKDWVVRIRK